MSFIRKIGEQLATTTKLKFRIDLDEIELLANPESTPRSFEVLMKRGSKAARSPLCVLGANESKAKFTRGLSLVASLFRDEKGAVFKEKKFVLSLRSMPGRKNVGQVELDLADYASLSTEPVSQHIGQAKVANGLMTLTAKITTTWLRQNEHRTMRPPIDDDAVSLGSLDSLDPLDLSEVVAIMGLDQSSPSPRSCVPASAAASAADLAAADKAAVEAIKVIGADGRSERWMRELSAERQEANERLVEVRAELAKAKADSRRALKAEVSRRVEATREVEAKSSRLRAEHEKALIVLSVEHEEETDSLRAKLARIQSTLKSTEETKTRQLNGALKRTETFASEVSQLRAQLARSEAASKAMAAWWNRVRARLEATLLLSKEDGASGDGGESLREDMREVTGMLATIGGQSICGDPRTETVDREHEPTKGAASIEANARARTLEKELLARETELVEAKAEVKRLCDHAVDINGELAAASEAEKRLSVRVANALTSQGDASRLRGEVDSLRAELAVANDKAGAKIRFLEAELADAAQNGTILTSELMKTRAAIREHEAEKSDLERERRALHDRTLALEKKLVEVRFTSASVAEAARFTAEEAVGSGGSADSGRGVPPSKMLVAQSWVSELQQIVADRELELSVNKEAWAKVNDALAVKNKAVCDELIDAKLALAQNAEELDQMRMALRQMRNALSQRDDENLELAERATYYELAYSNAVHTSKVIL